MSLLALNVHSLLELQIRTQLKKVYANLLSSTHFLPFPTWLRFTIQYQLRCSLPHFNCQGSSLFISTQCSLLCERRLRVSAEISQGISASLPYPNLMISLERIQRVCLLLTVTNHMLVHIIWPFEYFHELLFISRTCHCVIQLTVGFTAGAAPRWYWLSFSVYFHLFAHHPLITFPSLMLSHQLATYSPNFLSTRTWTFTRTLTHTHYWK